MPGTKSKFEDGSDLGTSLPEVMSVADFRWRLRCAPQLMGAGAGRRAALKERLHGTESSRFSSVTFANRATWKLPLHGFVGHPWPTSSEAADGADGRAECANPGTS